MTDDYLLVGAGGTATHLLPALARYLQARNRPFHVTVADADIVEAGNLARQIFHPNDIGLPKSLTICRGLPPEIVGITEFVTEINVDDLMPENTTVLIAVDNYEVRRTIDEQAHRLDDVTVINGGNETWTSSCQIHVRRGGLNLTPRISFMHPEIADAEPALSGPSCDERAVTGEEQTIASNLMSAAWMLSALALVHAHTHPAPDGPDATSFVSMDWHEAHTDIRIGRSGGSDWRLDGPAGWAEG